MCHSRTDNRASPSKKNTKHVTFYFLLKPSLSDVHQDFICSYAVTTLWVKVATVQSVLMFRLLLNITVSSQQPLHAPGSPEFAKVSPLQMLMIIVSRFQPVPSHISKSITGIQGTG